MSSWISRAAITSSIALTFAVGCDRCGEQKESGVDASGADATAGSAAESTTSPSPPSPPIKSRRTSSNPGPDVQRACYALGKARCTKLDACSKLGFMLHGGPLSRECVTRTVEQCLNEYAPKESTITLAAIGKCEKAQDKAACSDVLHGTVTGCEHAIGTLADGRACVFDAQCTSSFCERGAKDACGTCREAPKDGDDCKAGRCGGRLACVDGKCTKRAAKGGACKATAGCAPGLVCLDGKCVEPGKEGDPCDPVTPSCNDDEGLFCDPATTKCRPLTPAATGEACGEKAPGHACRADAVCEDGTCVAIPRHSESCTESGPACEPPTRCIGGHCATPDVASCGK